MIDTSIAAAHVATKDFRVRSVISRSGAVVSRHFLPFFIVAMMAYSPPLLTGSIMQIFEPIEPSKALSVLLWAFLGVVLLVVLSMLCNAIILHAAFQDMRRRPVRLVESLNVGLSRLLPLVGLTFVEGFLVLLGMVLLIIPGLILTRRGLLGCRPVSVGPWTRLRRSRELTKGFRWRVFALALLLFVVNAGSSSVIASVLTALAGPIVGLTGQLIWTGIAVAFIRVAVTITYYDLRVIKEGFDIEQITAVFD